MTQTPIPRSSRSLNVKLRFHVLLYNTMQIYSLSLELPISRSPLSVEPRQVLQHTLHCFLLPIITSAYLDNSKCRGLAWTCQLGVYIQYGQRGSHIRPRCVNPSRAIPPRDFIMGQSQHPAV